MNSRAFCLLPNNMKNKSSMRTVYANGINVGAFKGTYKETGIQWGDPCPHRSALALLVDNVIKK